MTKTSAGSPEKVHAWSGRIEPDEVRSQISSEGAISWIWDRGGLEKLWSKKLWSREDAVVHCQSSLLLV